MSKRDFPHIRWWLGGCAVLAVLGIIYLVLPASPALPGKEAPRVVFSAADGMEPILPLPPVPEQSPERVALGEKLFHDTRFSADGTLSCASCHPLGEGGDDGLRFSVGVGGALGAINAPTVFNAALNFVQFWDGRAATLEEQAAGPVHNPVELGSSWAQVLERLERDPVMVRAFSRAYPDGLTSENIVNAIATFERTLLTPDSRFDRYLRGDESALSALEIAGYRRFRELGCTSCHQGRLVGGNMYQKFGVLRDYFAGREPSQADLGRYNVTRRDDDRHVFKVPSLRMVAQTAPYFHDGSAQTLDEAIVVMGRYQLGRELTTDDVAAISAFLHALEGVLPKVGGK